MNETATDDQPTQDLLIKPATAADLVRVFEIEASSFTAPWSRRMFEVELQDNPFGSLWVARQMCEGTRDVIGYICFWIVFEELRLMNLGVDPSVRRRGIATALLNRTLTFGRERGAGRAVLEVRASNAAALSLYRKAGFHQEGRRGQYYSNPTEDAVLMVREPL